MIIIIGRNGIASRKAFFAFSPQSATGKELEFHKVPQANGHFLHKVPQANFPNSTKCHR